MVEVPRSLVVVQVERSLVPLEVNLVLVDLTALQMQVRVEKEVPAKLERIVLVWLRLLPIQAWEPFSEK